MKEQMTGTTKKKAGNRLLISVLVCSLLASCVLGFSQAKAADPIDLSTKPVTFNIGFSSEGQADDLGDNVVVDLYKVAEVEKVDKYDTYRFVLPTGSVYAGEGGLKVDDLNVENPDWAKISADAAAIAFKSDKPVLTGGKFDTPLTKDDKNQDLTVGLYLVVARGVGDLEKVENGVPKYLKTIKDADGNDKLVTIANSELLEYRFEPYLFAIPFRQGADDSGNTTNNTANVDVEWQYSTETYVTNPDDSDSSKTGLDYYAADESDPVDMLLKVKATTVPRLGSIKVIKSLPNYEKTTPATFVFQVVGYYVNPLFKDKEPEKIYDKVHGLTFSTSEIQSFTIEDLPAGTVLTIREIYTGAGYTLVVPADGVYDINDVDPDTGKPMTVIRAEEILEVTFVNDYNEDDKHGYGIINVIIKQDSGWTLDLERTRAEEDLAVLK